MRVRRQAPSSKGRGARHRTGTRGRDLHASSAPPGGQPAHRPSAEDTPSAANNRSTARRARPPRMTTASVAIRTGSTATAIAASWLERCLVARSQRMPNSTRTPRVRTVSAASAMTGRPSGRRHRGVMRPSRRGQQRGRRRRGHRPYAARLPGGVADAADLDEQGVDLQWIRRYRCTGCGHVASRHQPRSRTRHEDPAPWAGVALQAMAVAHLTVAHLTVARVADELGVAWSAGNDAVLAEGKRVLIDDEHRFDGVRVLGVDEHVWRHSRCGNKYVTVIIDFTPIRDGAGPARLLDMVEGRLKQAFKQWFAERPRATPSGPSLARSARGGRGGRLHRSRPPPPRRYPRLRSWIPFTWSAWLVTRWTSAAAGSSSASTNTRAAREDPLYSARRTLRTCCDLLTDNQSARLEKLFADDEHVEVEVTRVGLPAGDHCPPLPRPSTRPRADGQADRFRQPRRPAALSTFTKLAGRSSTATASGGGKPALTR